MKRQRPCVLVYNPISGHGHLDSWNALFVGFLLERGFRVLALTPDPLALKKRLAKRQLADCSRLQVLDWNTQILEPRPNARLREAWQWWMAYGYNYASRRPETRISPDMSVPARLKRRVFQVLVPPLFRATRAMHSLYRRTIGKPRSCDDVEDPMETHYFHPVEMAQRINVALKKSRWQPDFLFNMYLDMFRSGARAWRAFASMCSLSWGGIRFVPSDTPPPEGYYALPSLRGVCFLDEITCTKYRDSIPDKYFQYLPDVTNAELPEAPCALAEQIIRRAAGRNIVFLGGSIGGQKNIARWCELIALVDPKRWFFVQVGEVHANTFTKEDSIAFEKMLTAPPENFFLHSEYLADERDFNAIVRAASVIFAVYRNFRISSNMLGKAAYFEKPILVSQGFLLAERVNRYGIGLTVPEDDVKAMSNALEHLVTDPVSAVKFAAYRAVFSEQMTGDCLERFLNRAMAH